MLSRFLTVVLFAVAPLAAAPVRVVDHELYHA